MVGHGADIQYTGLQCMPRGGAVTEESSLPESRELRLGGGGQGVHGLAYSQPSGREKKLTVIVAPSEGSKRRGIGAGGGGNLCSWDLSMHWTACRL